MPTTLVQFAGRSTVLWAVVEAYPASAGAAAGGPAPPHRCCCCCCCYYAAMVLAWGAADAVRYLYFAARLLGAGGRQYRRLAWLRYSAFYALYPVGVAGEVGVVARAVAAARAQGSEGHAWAYLAAATLYVPGEFPFFVVVVVLSLASLRSSAGTDEPGRGRFVRNTSLTLALAVPTLFNHMRRQRRKVLASGKK